MTAALPMDTVAALKNLPFKTAAFTRLLDDIEAEPHGFRQHLLNHSAPKALAYNRIMQMHSADPSGIEFKHATRDCWAFVLPDASDVGRWRVQYFDVKGFFSHHTVNTLEQAVADMVNDSYIVEAKGILDRLADTPQWKRGMAVAALIQQLACRIITHEEFLERQKQLGPATPA